MRMDELAIISCSDGYLALDHFDNFLKARGGKVDANKRFLLPMKTLVTGMRTKRDYIHFSIPGYKHSYKVYQYVQSEDDFVETYFGT